MRRSERQIDSIPIRVAHQAPSPSCSFRQNLKIYLNSNLPPSAKAQVATPTRKIQEVCHFFTLSLSMNTPTHVINFATAMASLRIWMDGGQTHRKGKVFLKKYTGGRMSLSCGDFQHEMLRGELSISQHKLRTANSGTKLRVVIIEKAASFRIQLSFPLATNNRDDGKLFYLMMVQDE